MAAERQRRELSPAQQAALAKGRPWRKGQSGNPAGPKPGLNDLRALLEAAMQRRDRGKKGTRLERMVINLARKLAESDPQAVEFVGKRIWPAPVAIELTADLAIHDADREGLAHRIESGLAARVLARNGHDRSDGVDHGALTNGAGGDP